MTHANHSGLVARGLLFAAAVASLLMNACDRKAEPPAATPASVSSEWRAFEGSWNAAGTRRAIPLGTDRKGSIINLRGTMLLAGEGRPGVGFRADVIALVDTETGLVGRAVWTDENGDEVYSELKGEGTKESNHIAGTFLGGTGPYKGVSGTYEFSWHFVIESEDGSIQGRAADLKGRFRLDGSTPVGAGEAGGANR